MSHNFSRFNNQVAVVTGGADGIGKAVAKRLSDEGAKVYLFDSDQNLLDKAEEEIANHLKFMLTLQMIILSGKGSKKLRIMRVSLMWLFTAPVL